MPLADVRPGGMLIEHDLPRAHLVMDDFFSPPALDTIFRELRGLERHLKPGLVRDIGHDGQSVFFEHRRRRNRAVWIHDPSKTLRLFREHLWSDFMVESFDQANEPLFQIIGQCHAPHLQVSSYMTGDHYDFHEDEGAGVNLTAIVFLAANPEKVRGGDLVLSYGGGEARVRFAHNRLVIFPSRTLHRVTRVRVDSTDPADARISLQCWLAHGRQEEKPKNKPKRRAPEADRPTFLLAEDSILAAAQALSHEAKADQTPEDLYWGAFYLSRILSANLRCLASEQADLELGQVRVRRRAALEVYGRGRLAGEPVRVGFRLDGPSTAPAEALALFVEKGRGEGSATLTGRVPPGASEHETSVILARLLARARLTPSRDLLDLRLPDRRVDHHHLRQPAGRVAAKLEAVLVLWRSALPYAGVLVDGEAPADAGPVEVDDHQAQGSLEVPGREPQPLAEHGGVMFTVLHRLADRLLDGRGGRRKLVASAVLAAPEVGGLRVDNVFLKNRLGHQPGHPMVGKMFALVLRKRPRRCPLVGLLRDALLGGVALARG